MSDILYIVMPAYNEEENIGTVIGQWYPILKDKSIESRIVVADSGSTDKTHEILLRLQKSCPQLEVISDTGKYHGPKVIALYDYAIKHNADYIFQTDSDGQTDPDEFYGFWTDREQYAGIFGKRRKRADGKIREFVEQVVCIMLRMYFGVKIPDANAPFRLMKTDILKKYLYRLSEDYSLPNIMITTFFVYNNEAIAFRDISFSARNGGGEFYKHG